MWWLAQPAVAGLAAGVLAKFLDLASGPLGVLGSVGSALGPWVVIVTLFSLRAPSRRLATASGSVLLLASLVGYYATYRLIDGNVSLGVMAFWAWAAVTAGPLLAGLVSLAPRAGWWGAIAIGCPAGLLLGEAIEVAVWIAGPFSTLSWWVLAALDIVAAVVIVAYLPSDARTRRLALMATVPLFTALGFGVTHLPRLFAILVLGGH